LNPHPKFPDGGTTCHLHYVSTLPTYSDSSLGTLNLEINLADIIGDDRHKKGKKLSWSLCVDIVELHSV